MAAAAPEGFLRRSSLRRAAQCRPFGNPLLARAKMPGSHFRAGAADAATRDCPAPALRRQQLAQDFAEDFVRDFVGDFVLGLQSPVSERHARCRRAALADLTRLRCREAARPWPAARVRDRLTDRAGPAG